MGPYDQMLGQQRQQQQGGQSRPQMPMIGQRPPMPTQAQGMSQRPPMGPPGGLGMAPGGQMGPAASPYARLFQQPQGMQGGMMNPQLQQLMQQRLMMAQRMGQGAPMGQGGLSAAPPTGMRGGPQR